MAKDGKHYWLTPKDVFEKLDEEFNFDFDPCPHPKPDDFDGLTAEWGMSNYVNPPFFEGISKWARKADEECKKGKTVVLVYPLDKAVMRLIEMAKEVRNLGDIKWRSIEDGQPGTGTGRYIACFVLGP
jgi:hypothetical protein